MKSLYLSITLSVATCLVGCSDVGPDDFAHDDSDIQSSSSELKVTDCWATYLKTKETCQAAFNACYCAKACGGYVTCGGKLWGCTGEPCLSTRNACFASAKATFLTCKAQALAK